jgi:hypothetical protein
MAYNGVQLVLAAAMLCLGFGEVIAKAFRECIRLKTPDEDSDSSICSRPAFITACPGSSE